MIRNIYILLLLSLSFGTVTDIDGNVYETVQIGAQLWIAENLKVTHYNNGDEIPNLTINNDWTSASIGAYSDYDNNPTNSETYGRLYNWYTVNDERGICPEGYHVPTDDEYSELEVYLGMSESETNIIGFRGTNEGSKLAGNSELWNIGVLVIDPEFGTSGFNALPAGFRVYSSGDFDTVGKHCYYWSSSENSNSHAWYRNLLYFNTRVYRNSPSKQSGFSIRCLGDEITTGCTHPNATNYDETANVDDGSCEYECDEGFIEIDGECYYQSDLDVLQQFIDNSQEGDVSPSWLPVPSDLMPLELGLQTWENGRLVEFCCSTWYVGCHSDYELTGDIPSEVGNLTHLTWLGLHNNNLSGEIPPEIGNLVNLEMLHLSSNQLSGEIPSEIGNLENLYHLWLYSNALSGEIPESICNINLDWEASWIDGLPSYIYNNQLCPTYPDCLEENIGYQDTSECYGCTDPEATNFVSEVINDDGSCEYDYTIELHAGTNLVSFWALPEDNSLDSMFADLDGIITGVIGEGIAAVPNGTLGWIGSLSEISCTSGYWVTVSEDVIWDIVATELCPCDLPYTIHEGSNLVSWPSSNSCSVGDAIPDDFEPYITGIIGEGVATIPSETFEWSGSLTSLQPNKGYWLSSSIEIYYNWDACSCSGSFSRTATDDIKINSEYFNQSTKQAFYFIESIENIEIGDRILAYNSDNVIGARQWTGTIIDVPAMGDDGSDYTKGYMEAGGVPSFKILRGDKLINLEGEIPAFENNQLYIVSSLTEAVALPEAFSLDRAYPNPFNPVTTLSFALPIEAEVSLSIYNLQGREVVTLVNGNMDTGYHSVVWNADRQASGVYFVKMLARPSAGGVAGEYIHRQKLMLIK